MKKGMVVHRKKCSLDMSLTRDDQRCSKGSYRAGREAGVYGRKGPHVGQTQYGRESNYAGPHLRAHHEYEAIAPAPKTVNNAFRFVGEHAKNDCGHTTHTQAASVLAALSTERHFVIRGLHAGANGIRPVLGPGNMCRRTIIQVGVHDTVLLLWVAFCRVWGSAAMVHHSSRTEEPNERAWCNVSWVALLCRSVPNLTHELSIPFQCRKMMTISGPTSVSGGVSVTDPYTGRRRGPWAGVGVVLFSGESTRPRTPASPTLLLLCLPSHSAWLKLVTHDA